MLIGLVFSLGLHAQAELNRWQDLQANKKGMLEVYYFDNLPFAFEDSSKRVRGIETEILQEFIGWVRGEKGVDLGLKFTRFNDFKEFYDAVKNEVRGVVGVGSVTINKHRRKEIKFSEPYLKNVAVLVSSVEVNTLVSLKEMKKEFSGRKAIVVKGSTHEKALFKMRKKYFHHMPIEYAESPEEVLNKIASDPSYFSYMDLITYKDYTKSKRGMLRVHEVGNLTDERFGFIFPINSDWDGLFNDFLSSGFFTRAEYHKILDNYLDIEVINDVQLR